MPYRVVKKGEFRKPKLKRALGLLEVTMYGIGIIFGAGIYVLIGKGAGIAGNALWLSFIFGAIIAAITGLSYAELGSLFPKEAAEYVYSKKAFKNRLLPFIIGWILLFTGVVSASAVSLGFGGYLSALTGFNPLLVAMVLIIVLSLINFFGIKEAAKFNILFTIVETIGLLLIIILGFKFLGSVDLFEAQQGFAGIFTAAALVFFAFLGFEDMVNVSEETRKPKKVIPKAIILSLVITTIIYVLVSMVSVSVVPWNILSESSAPLADVAEGSFAGSAILLSFIALFATANTVLIILIVTSRMIWGMADQGSLPKILSKIHPERRTPWISVFFVMLFAIIFVLIGEIEIVAQMTNFGVFLVFLSVNASLIALRYKMPNLERPFKVPINIGRLPVLPVIGILFCLFMLFYIELSVVLFGLAVIGAGTIFYFILKGKNGQR